MLVSIRHVGYVQVAFCISFLFHRLWRILVSALKAKTETWSKQIIAPSFGASLHRESHSSSPTGTS